jgi:hypothetical protein
MLVSLWNSSEPLTIRIRRTRARAVPAAGLKPDKDNKNPLNPRKISLIFTPAYLFCGKNTTFVPPSVERPRKSLGGNFGAVHAKGSINNVQLFNLQNLSTNK